ncbi:MAG: hypothetical protein C7B45_10680 [Sulfobacillus acidophilus]|uniref:SPW repeat-containing integral membrane domain-containing protein n=1 Tax=Sulfobacillus acidophilus TaxID=53633 RepID=A0A2T2WGX1_9FIRM|nr:MAG: hypothetical protein C7B45_10680 [Sulfobacillus acidophilus]
MMWRNWLMAVVGAWFVVSAWVLNPMHSSTYLWTAIILGGLVLIGSLWELSDKAYRRWVYYPQALFGLYLGLSPFFYTFSRFAWATAVTVVLGAVILALGLWQAIVRPSDTSTKPDAPHHRAAS